MDIEVINNDLASQIRAFNQERGWTKFHTPKNLAMALAAEAGELLAEFQWLTPAESETARAEGPLRERVTSEIADVAIYLTQLAERLAVDIDKAVADKVRLNEQRFEGSAGNSWLPSDPS